MTSRRTWLAAVSLAALVGNAAWAAAGSDALRRFVEETRSASGRFTQRLTDRKGEALDAPAEGIFCFRRPGLFAWRTEIPFVQEIVSDGKVVKLWDRDLNQVTVKSLSGAVTAAPAALLFGDAKALDVFQLTESPRREAGAVAAVQAVPKKDDAAFSEVSVGFDAGGSPVFMVLADHFGTVTTLTFTDVRKNPALTNADFALHAPADADVLEDHTGNF